jgi:hypothetical protein
MLSHTPEGLGWLGQGVGQLVREGEVDQSFHGFRTRLSAGATPTG